METLFTLYPNVQDLLGTPPDDLAPVLLVLARGAVQNGMFWPDNVNEIAISAPSAVPIQSGYPSHQRPQIEVLLAQVWTWLERNDLIARASGQNGRNGWMIITKQGEGVSDAQDLQRIRAAAEFPKSLLHPSIAEKAWRGLMRNDLDDAVLHAFIAVEDAVRRAGGFGDSDLGVNLMRDAFYKDRGPLRDPRGTDAECESMMHLFAGAIGAFKNRRSHHIVNSSDLREAQDRVLLASHLLRIVDTRGLN